MSNVTDLVEHREKAGEAGRHKAARAVGETLAELGQGMAREGETIAGFLVVMAYLPKGGGHARLPTIMGSTVEDLDEKRKLVDEFQKATVNACEMYKAQIEGEG